MSGEKTLTHSRRSRAPSGTEPQHSSFPIAARYVEDKLLDEIFPEGIPDELAGFLAEESRYSNPLSWDSGAGGAGKKSGSVGVRLVLSPEGKNPYAISGQDLLSDCYDASLDIGEELIMRPAIRYRADRDGCMELSLSCYYQEGVPRQSRGEAIRALRACCTELAGRLGKYTKP